MIELYLLTSYTTDGLGDYVPQVLVDLAVADLLDPHIYRNATGDAPGAPYNPNVVVAHLSISEAAFAWLEAHPDYGPGAILYDLPNPYGPNDPPPAAEYGLRRAYCARLGMSNTRFRLLFGTQASPLTRRAGADNLITWVRSL